MTVDAVREQTRVILRKPEAMNAPHPQIHTAGPDARVITIPDGFLTHLTMGDYRITTITIQRQRTQIPQGEGVEVTLQGTDTAEGEFADLAGRVGTSEAIFIITMDAPPQVADALQQALAQLRHPTGAQHRPTPTPTDLTEYRSTHR